jgi:hypothetical protein
MYMKVFMVVTLGALICLPGTAGAWTLSGIFYEDGGGHGPFTKIEQFMIDGTTFDAPFIVDSSIAGQGWDSVLVNPTYSLVTGPLTTRLLSGGQFTVELPDPSSTPHVLDYLVWNGSTLLYAQRITWNGTGQGGDYHGWSFPTITSDGIHYTYAGVIGEYDRADLAPLPPSILLLGMGLVGLGGWRLKKG